MRGTALGYPDAGVSGRTSLPDGWCEASAEEVVGAGVAAFDAASDDLMSFALHRRAGVRVVTADPATWTDLDLLDGPMRGPCRLLRVIDESLRQGVVVGTLERNRAVAEHRCHLELDPDRGTVRATVRAVWRPRAGTVLPGAAERERWSYRNLVDRLVRELRADG